MISVTRTEPKCCTLYPSNHKPGTLAYCYPDCLYVRTVRLGSGIGVGIAEYCWMSINQGHHNGTTYDKVDGRILGPGDMLTMNFKE